MDGPSRVARKELVEQLDEVSGADFQTLADQLFAVADLLDSQLRLRRALSDPASPAEVKEQLVDRLFGEQLSDEATSLLRDASGKRWSHARDLSAVLDQLGAQALLMGEEAGDGDLDDVEDELFRFSRLVEREPRLALALTDPTLPAERKGQLVERLLEDKARDTTVRLISRVAQHPRGRRVPAALEELANLAAARRQRSIAVVTVARPLDEDQQERLRSALSSAFGRDLELEIDVDPSLLGGVVVRIGDELVDGSVVRRISEVRRRLLH